MSSRQGLPIPEDGSSGSLHVTAIGVQSVCLRPLLIVMVICAKAANDLLTPQWIPPFPLTRG
jgi:hypothetical protein